MSPDPDAKRRAKTLYTRFLACKAAADLAGMEAVAAELDALAAAGGTDAAGYAARAHADAVFKARRAAHGPTA